MIGRAFRTASATRAWGSAVFAAAEEGGAHAGFLRNYAGRTVGERAKAMRSLEKSIAEHEGFLENPASHVENWEDLRPQHQQSLMRHWRDEIRTASEQIEILKRIQ